MLETSRKIGNVVVAEGDYADIAELIDTEGANAFREIVAERKIPYSPEDVEAIIVDVYAYLDAEEEAGR